MLECLTKPYKKYINKVITIKKLNSITSELFYIFGAIAQRSPYPAIMFKSLTKYNILYDCKNDIILFDVIELRPSDYVISLYIEPQKNPYKIKILDVAIES